MLSRLTNKEPDLRNTFDVRVARDICISEYNDDVCAINIYYSCEC